MNAIVTEIYLRLIGYKPGNYLQAMPLVYLIVYLTVINAHI